MFDPQSYTVIASIFPRLLGLIYFFAFGAFFFQIRGLIGSKGILPIKDYLQALQTYYPRNSYLKAPGIFWLTATNTALEAVVAAGIILSVGLMLGVFPPLMLLLLYLLYLSIVSVAQDFLSFGWVGIPAALPFPESANETV